MQSRYTKATIGWTRVAESNRPLQFCRLLPGRLANARDWCARRISKSRPIACRATALPLSYSRILRTICFGFQRPTRGAKSAMCSTAELPCPKARIGVEPMSAGLCRPDYHLVAGKTFDGLATRMGRPDRLRGVGIEPTRTCVLHHVVLTCIRKAIWHARRACRMVLIKEIGRPSPTRETSKSRHVRSM